MPEEPTDPTHDAESELESIAMDDSETTADFLEHVDPANQPPVLRLTANPEESHRQDALDRLERWESGEAVPRVINFEHPSDLRALLTDRRVELLRSIMSERPESIRRLADRVDRDVKSVHDDLQVLAAYGIVHFEQAGRAKRPFVPYETIEVNLEISTPSSTDDVASA